MPESSSNIPASETPTPVDQADLDTDHVTPSELITPDSPLKVTRAYFTKARVRKKNRKKLTVPLSERAAYSVVEAGALLGLGESKSYELAASGEIPTIKIGRLRRVPAARFRQKFGLIEPEAK